MNQSGSTTNIETRLCFQLPGIQFLLVKVEEVVFIEANREISYLNVQGKEKVSVISHLGYYKPTLVEHYGFIVISKSVIVNSRHIVRYHPKERLLLLSDGTELMVANSQKRSIMAFFRQINSFQMIEPCSDDK
ncbi:MAG: LytTR family transcriptional regulator [Saprospiraceae bacterium]|nr:LytTR family transcriptional regulator [Saprospiraceae bacterium]